MKVIGKLKLIHSVAVAGLALCVSAGLAKAQTTYKGEFTLPFEAQWGSAVLPPGHYTFSIARPTPSTEYAVFLRGEGKSAIILPVTMPDEKVSSERSNLTLVNTGERYVVRSFEAVELGKTFEYPIAKAKMKQMADNRDLMRQVPVLTSAP
ncbi:MAG TPA: hypothetical protein VG204_18725 [Terriglobia bacterium]|nr:hypothetical protein [Terriglobia bacterium]